MTLRAFFMWVGLALLLAPTHHVKAQEPPLVVFITGVNIETTTFAQSGPLGVQKLASIFDDLGAQVRLLEETLPIPEGTQVVVLTRPLEPMNLPLAMRLWAFLRDGGNLMLAYDPTNYFLGATNIDRNVGRTVLLTMLYSDYGILLENSALIPFLANDNTILSFGTMVQLATPEVIANPITQPHQQYGLPLRFWGARHITAEPFGLYSFAVPLFYNEDTYAERNTGIFPTARGRLILPASAPFGYTSEVDTLGRLHIAAYAQNTNHRSRVLLLADSEMLQNGFGLSGTVTNPIYPGNAIFAQRAAAWLMELPVSNWPSLPSGFTWLSGDDSATDWEDLARRYNISDRTYNGGLARVRGLYNDLYAYLGLNAATGETITSATLTLPDGGRIEATGDGLTYINVDGTATLIPDGEAVPGAFMEIRLPLRFFWRNQVQLLDICTPTDCTGLYQLTPLGLRAPHDFALNDGISGTIGQVSSPDTSVVNIRAAPNLDSTIVGVIPVGGEIAVLGISPDGDWFRVRNALGDGWMADFLLTINGDPAQLPVIDLPDDAN